VVKVKAYLRQAKARNDPDLLAAIAEALRLVSPSDAQGFFVIAALCALYVKMI
jgi:hypothetical protein